MLTTISIVKHGHVLIHWQWLVKEMCPPQGSTSKAQEASDNYVPGMQMWNGIHICITEMIIFSRIFAVFEYHSGQLIRSTCARNVYSDETRGSKDEQRQ